MAVNSDQGKHPAGTTFKLASTLNDVCHQYQLLGRDIELLRDFLTGRDERAGIDLRIAACFLTCNMLGAMLAKMQIAALSDERH